jgi:hypothetical protein
LLLAEERLLLCCARVHLSSTDRQELEALLKAGLHWPALLAETAASASFRWSIVT